MAHELPPGVARSNTRVHTVGHTCNFAHSGESTTGVRVVSCRWVSRLASAYLQLPTSLPCSTPLPCRLSRSPPAHARIGSNNGLAVSAFPVQSTKTRGQGWGSIGSGNIAAGTDGATRVCYLHGLPDLLVFLFADLLLNIGHSVVAFDHNSIAGLAAWRWVDHFCDSAISVAGAHNHGKRLQAAQLGLR